MSSTFEAVENSAGIEAPGAVPASVRARLAVDNFATAEMCHYWRDHFSHPPLFNPLGCFRVGPDPMSIHNFMFPPFSGHGEGTAMFYIDGKHPVDLDAKIGYTWYPDRVVRRTVLEEFEIQTVTRALADQPGAAIRLFVANPTAAPRRVEIGIKLAGRLIHTVDGWASIGPQIQVEDEHRESWNYDERIGAMNFASAERAFLTQGTSPTPHRVEGKTLVYNVEVPARGTWVLDFVAVMADTAEGAKHRYVEAITGIESTHDATRTSWSERILNAFTPGNSLYSGHLPSLVTSNKALEDLYYTTALGCLTLRRENPLSSYGPAYVTLSPNYWTTASFLWDMMIAAPFYALLDPALLRNHIEVWLQADIRSCLATDYVTGKSLGYWYAVNSTAIVRLAHDYLRYTSDFDWLNKSIDGRPIIDHLQQNALVWHEYDRNGHGLADCGGVMNLLECVSTYTHEVASFNAMWVAALRQVAAMRRLLGQADIARELEDDAKGLLATLMTLYVDGKGHWRCRQPDGSYNDIHHIYDFVAVLESICDDLPPNIREEMVANFKKNHQTENWVRSLAAWDDDAHRAVRVDHQWTGAYTSIPAQALNGLFRAGHGDHAFDWLQRVARVTRQGPVGQAHWAAPLFPSFEGGPWKATYIMPFITDWVCSSNGAYPAMIIESVFGVDATLTNGLKWRGAATALAPSDSLENLTYQGKSYRVSATAGITNA